MKKSDSIDYLTKSYKDFTVEIPVSIVLGTFQVLLITGMVCYNLVKHSR